MFSQRNGSRGAWLVALGVAVMLVLLGPNAEAKLVLKEEIGEKEVKLKLYGFSQLEMRGGDGFTSEGGVFFRAQRIRFGFNYFHGPIAGKLFMDVNQSFTNNEGNLPKAVKDAFVAYKWSNAAFIRLGMIKTPVGMHFTIPGWNLDTVERNLMEKGLDLERDFGLMISGRLIGQERFSNKKQMEVNGLEMGTERQGYGFGYDLGVFNPAGRSGAVIWDTGLLGDALAYAGRLHYDWGPQFHAELSYGLSEQAGGTASTILATNPLPTATGLLGAGPEDYAVWDLGIASELWDHNMEIKFEYIDGTDIRGLDGWDQSSASLTFGYLVVPSLELVIRTFQAESDRPEQVDDGLGGITTTIRSTDLGNTYLGFNVFLARVSDKHRDLQRHKLTVNYVFTNGDDVDASTQWAGVGGYRDDVWIVQWQFKY